MNLDAFSMKPSTPLSTLGLSTKVYQILQRHGIHTLQDLLLVSPRVLNSYGIGLQVLWFETGI